jgi:glycosyltransferase involved in cell wall biosynthesis
VLAKRAFDHLSGSGVVAGARELIAVSPAEAADLPRPARLVGNGVEPSGASSRRAATGGPLLFVGSDRPQKRGQALPALMDALPAARLRLVGPMGPRFIGLFRRFGGRIEASGVLEGDALAEAYACAALLVHPAVGEAFGFAPFEAALHGACAVVAGGHGCGERYGRAGGCVVPPDDAPALAAAVRARLADAALAAREAASVADFTRRELTWERAAREAEDVYREASRPASAA